MNNPLESEELVDLSESKEKFASEFQGTYANAFLRVLAVVGVPLSAAIAYRVLTNSLPAYFWVVIFLVVTITLGAFVRQRLSIKQKTILLMAPIIFISLFQVANQGLYSQAPLTIAILIATTIVFRNQVSTPIIAVIVTCLIMYAANLHLSSVVSINELSTNGVVYIRVFTTLSLLLLLGVLILTLVNALYERSELLMIANIENSRVVADLTSTLEELTLLRKTINVCANCRKVRRDSDDDENESWYTLEEYVEENTNTSLSHGYCQQCFDEAISKV
ncbi:MAG: hypothetical protein QMC01_08835 [Pseudomonadales bacterium]|jgi:hypothetical protein|tara:strand:- start:3400 stop:4230 length:831 start_codon:yes stop_codon:yes gene_type:complete